MNKFELMTVVLLSDYTKDQKLLLQELILRMNDEGLCYPSVERLCKVLGIKHAKNFKGVDHYLPGLVTIEKRGKKNFYRINTPALEGVTEAEVVPCRGSWKQRQGEVTPALEGVVTPAVAEVTPALAEVTPAVEGVNSTYNTTEDNTRESTSKSPVADAPVDSNPLNSILKDDEEEIEVVWDIEEPFLTFREVGSSDSLNLKLQDAAQSEAVEAKKENMSIIEWNKLHYPTRSSDWDSVEKFYNDPEYLPNQKDPSERLQAAIRRVAEMEWASW